MTSHLRPGLAVASVALGVAVLTPATAGAVGLPPVFPRTIAILHDTPQVHPTSFEVRTENIGKRRITVKVRVTLFGIGAPRKVVISVGPCTGGTATSPLCKPTAAVRVTAPRGGTSWTRAFVIARPSARRDALRVTLTPAGEPVPYRPERVGGGGGMGEILLNGGTWRYLPGTMWGIRIPSQAGIALSQVKFNSRTYTWSGKADRDVPVSTTIGYTGEKPRWTFANTMRADAAFTFRRTPTAPVQERRTAPKRFDFAATIADSSSLFSLRVPLPAWDPAG